MYGGHCSDVLGQFGINYYYSPPPMDVGYPMAHLEADAAANRAESSFESKIDALSSGPGMLSNLETQVFGDDLHVFSSVSLDVLEETCCRFFLRLVGNHWVSIAGRDEDG